MQQRMYKINRQAIMKKGRINNELITIYAER